MNVPQTTAAYTEKLRQALQRDTTLRQLAAQATTRYAGEKARIDRGLVIALNGGVTLKTDAALVSSTRDDEVFSIVRDGHCDCPDFAHAPGGRCKHVWAKCLIKRAQQAGAYYTSTTESQGLVLGGHKATADAQREVDGDLVRKVCHHNGARRN